MTLPGDLSSPSIKGGKQVQCPIAPILMFDPIGEPRLRWFRGMEPRPWLQGGFFIEAEDHLIGLEGAGVESDKGGHLCIEGRIAGIFRRQPHLMPPWFALVMSENPADRGRRDGLRDPRLDEGTRQCGAIPLGETPPTEVEALTGQLDQMDGNVGGKSP